MPRSRNLTSGEFSLERSNTFLQLFDSSRLTDARFGARHVHRIIEEQALQPLVLEPPGAYRAEVNGTTCTWVAADAGGEG